MLVHTALTTHKEPQTILVITDEVSEFQAEFDKHKFLNLDIKFSENLETIQDAESDSKDIIIISKKVEDKKIFAHSSRVLKSNGLISTCGDFSTLEDLASEFRIAMPYLVNSLDEKSTTLLFGSKFFHPTADINLQRADFLDDCKYYNSDIHTASFIMPNFIKSAIKDFVKN
jgi:spermidine synthase